MQTSLMQLLWRHYRRRMGALGVIAVLLGFWLAWSETGSWSHQLTGAIFDAQIHQWTVYTQATMGSLSLYPGGLLFMGLLVGLLLMNGDLKDHFNGFLFMSGYRRTTIYWHKALLGIGTLLAMALVTTVIHYAVYLSHLAPGQTFNLALPGLLTSWGYGFLQTVGFFTIGWFAALIVGQTGPLVITVAGFLVSLIGVVPVIERLWFPTQPVSAQADARLAGVLALGWLLAIVILLPWGAWLYRRLSLENDGHYLLFAGLRWPVFLVYVVYLGLIFVGNHVAWSPMTLIYAAFVVFGYLWLWRPHPLEWWRRRHTGIEK